MKIVKSRWIVGKKKRERGEKKEKEKRKRREKKEEKRKEDPRDSSWPSQGKRGLWLRPTDFDKQKGRSAAKVAQAKTPKPQQASPVAPHPTDAHPLRRITAEPGNSNSVATLPEIQAYDEVAGVRVMCVLMAWSPVAWQHVPARVFTVAPTKKDERKRRGSF